jgi:hypothetical protein
MPVWQLSTPFMLITPSEQLLALRSSAMFHFPSAAWHLALRVLPFISMFWQLSVYGPEGAVWANADGKKAQASAERANDFKNRMVVSLEAADHPQPIRRNTGEVFRVRWSQYSGVPGFWLPEFGGTYGQIP